MVTAALTRATMANLNTNTLSLRGYSGTGWTRIKQDNDEIRMTNLEVMPNDQ